MMKKIELSYSFIFIVFSFIITGHFINFIIFFSIIFIHELGHIFIAKLFKVKINKIIFYPYGGITKLDYLININLYKELLISFGGFIFQLIYSFIVYYLYKVGFIREYVYLLFYKYTCSIFIFNMLPIIPLDGFKILNTIINYIFNYNLSNYISVVISFISIILFLYLNNNFDYSFILILSILFKNIYEYLFNIKYLYNRFLLERYLYDIKYKDKKIINNKNNFYRNKNHYIKYNNSYKKEKDYLKMIFK